MRSSSGAHYLALDHVRALATFMVFVWHFTHGYWGYPSPFEGAPSYFFPFALFDEGHTGVALFMTLSGYLFWKLLEGRQIHFGRFLYSRAVRLLPLLVVVLIAGYVIEANRGGDLAAFRLNLLRGFIHPAWPGGAWSITVELHYYILLPLLLWLQRRSARLALAIIAFALAARALIYQQTGEVHLLSYWTIVGRIDQFVFGMLICQQRKYFANRPRLVAATFLALSGFYFFFDYSGGLRGIHQSYWVFLPTLEGLSYAILIAWYDERAPKKTSRLAVLLGKLGEYSYSIYLLHFFVVFELANWVHLHVLPLTNFYVALFAAVPAFLAIAVVGGVSHHLIERPFLRLRKPYFKAQS